MRRGALVVAALAALAALAVLSQGCADFLPTGYRPPADPTAWKSEVAHEWKKRALEESDLRVRHELRERACLLSPDDCLTTVVEWEDDPMFVYRMGRIICERLPERCHDLNNNLRHHFRYCPDDKPDCPHPKFTPREACLMEDDDACIAIGRELTARAR
jgi:hypothetical protein